MIALVKRGGNEGGRFPTLDLSGVRFPSDDLTIRTLRQTHSDLFDIGIVNGENAQPKFFFHSSHGGHATDTVAAMLYCERLIATDAYAAAKGVDGMETGATLDDFKEELTKLYARYGISNGPHHAAELIRDIERQGAALANERQP